MFSLSDILLVITIEQMFGLLLTKALTSVLPYLVCCVNNRFSWQM